MADQWAVKFSDHGFSNDVLMGASEGEYFFRLGLFRRRLTVVDLPEGAVIKDGCTGSATHTLTLQFETTTTNTDQIWSKVYQRMQTAWDGVPGTLEVPDYPPLPNCTVMNVELSEQVRIAKATGAGLDLVDGVTVEAVITFEQTSS